MSGYNRELVERLLPAVWDQSFAYGMEAPLAPDPDMPKTKANPSHSNTLYAHLADIKSAWWRSDLTFKQRRALFLRYACDWREQDIAAIENITQPTISVRLSVGVDRIIEHLNGTTGREEQDGSETDQ